MPTQTKSRYELRNLQGLNLVHYTSVNLLFGEEHKVCTTRGSASAGEAVGVPVLRRLDLEEGAVDGVAGAFC